MPKLIIFDVDGVLCQTKSGKKFRAGASDWQLKEGVKDKLAVLRRQGIHLAIASNQGGVAFGLLDETAIRQEIQKLALELDIDFVAVCCAHPEPKFGYEEYADEEELKRRKPAPGMLYEAMAHYGSFPQDTLMVGDMESDRQAAKAAGVAFQWARDFFQPGLTWTDLRTRIDQLTQMAVTGLEDQTDQW